jgi:MFS transporter, SP family, xylose:H+ symportor
MPMNAVPPGQTGVPAGRISSYLIRSAIVASFCGLLFGFEIAVISGTTEWLRTHFGLSDFMLGFTVASGLIGAITGSAVVARPADAFGRRSVLFGLAVLFLAAAIGCALAWDLISFIAFRFLGGIAVGAASVIAPVYIAELSPAAYRGRLVTIQQLNIVLGILFAYLSNYFVGQLHLGDNEARWMFGIMALPSALFFLMLFFTPQSPRWLIGRGRVEEARIVLRKCGESELTLEGEIQEIRHSFDTTHHDLQECLFQRKYLKPILLAITIAGFNQLSGINAVLYYSGNIFKLAGADRSSALLQSVVVGLTLLVFTIAALGTIDRFGRRRLMFVGSLGYIVGLVAVAYAFASQHGGALVLVSLLIFVGAHAFGQGGVIWVFIGEIFPNRVRARGQALGSFTHWIMSAAISWSFPVIAAYSATYAFVFYALCMFAQLMWVLFVMPETKGVSLEGIQHRLGIE